MTLKIFISSRNDDKVVLNGVEGSSLTDIRKYLKKEIESIKLFDQDFFTVRINEDFGANTSADSYNKCLEEVKDSDFLISLYNGSAGWAPKGIDLGICQAELEEAMNISTRKASIIDISKYFSLKTKDPEEKKRNEAFRIFMDETGIFNNPLKVAAGKATDDGFKNELLSSIKNIIYQHIIERFRLSNVYYNISGDNRISLNWKKLKYTDRDTNIRNILNQLVSANPDFNIFEYRVFSVPDQMSVEDAKAYTGRPFLKEQEFIRMPVKGKKVKHGPVHFIGVYGNATEIQVKKLIGFPDVSTMKDDFGIYVWEQNTHIQLIFLTECKTPSATKAKFQLFYNWCRFNREYQNIKKRASARYHILKSINEARKIVEN